MHEHELPLPPTPRTRGVFRAPAPAGWIAFQAISSNGHELAYTRRLRSAFDPTLIITLWNVLEVSDPLTEEQRLAALLRAALPGSRRRRRIRHA